MASTHPEFFQPVELPQDSGLSQFRRDEHDCTANPTIPAVRVFREREAVVNTVLEYLLLGEKMVVEPGPSLWSPEESITGLAGGQLTERDEFEPLARIIARTRWELMVDMLSVTISSEGG